MDASAEADIVYGAPAGTQLTGTGICENGWIQIEYEGQVVYGSGDYLLPVDTGTAPAEAAPVAEAPVEAAAAPVEAQAAVPVEAPVEAPAEVPVEAPAETPVY